MLRRWKTTAAVWLATGLAMCAIVHAARAPKTAPEIFSIDPSKGPAGATVKVTGTGFERTRYVLFAAGRTGQQAKFKVVSDKELEVTAPPYLREGTTATVVVVTANGAAVGVPASVLELDHRQKGGGTTATFYHVRNGGTLGASQGVVVVDEGGQATASETSAICFVKNGGTLEHADRFSGLVIHEPGAILQAGPNPYNPATRLLQVSVISTSPGVEPFLYQRPAAPATHAETPPEVTSIAPRRVPASGILTLQGTGFSETSEVLVLAGESAKNEAVADFQIVSDKELQVQIPEQLLGDARLVIINPKGATLVIARNDLLTIRGPAPRGTSRSSGHDSRRATHARNSANPVTQVADRAIVKDAGLRGVYFVEQGGRVTHTGGSCVYFVKNGGRVDGSGGRVLVVRELRATISIDGTKRNAESEREMESVNLSVIPAMFEIVPP